MFACTRRVSVCREIERQHVWRDKEIGSVCRDRERRGCVEK